jgi:hypothetical protein
VYSFTTYDSNPNVVYNIIAHVASQKEQNFLIKIDNGGEPLQKVFQVQYLARVFSNFEDVIWECVHILLDGPEHIFVKFLDGLTNFCKPWAMEMLLQIPFDASAKNYLSLIEKFPH